MLNSLEFSEKSTIYSQNLEGAKNNAQQLHWQYH